MSGSFAIPLTVAHQALCPWDFPGKNTGMGCHFFLQGIFPTQGWNSCLLLPSFRSPPDVLTTGDSTWTCRKEVRTTLINNNDGPGLCLEADLCVSEGRGGVIDHFH